MKRTPIPDVLLHHWIFKHPLIPMRYIAETNSKKPRTDWKQYQEVGPGIRPDYATLARWNSRWPDALWAMVTGETSRLFTLDFDGDPGRDLLTRWGLEPHRRTHSGGFHVDVAWPDFTVRNAQWKSNKRLAAIAPGLDIRGTGGLAVVHGTTPKGSYETLLHGAEPPFHVEPHPFEVVPEELVAFLHETAIRGRRRTPTHKPSRRSTQVPKLTKSTSIPADLTVAQLIGRATDRVRDGAGRNDTGFWLACQLRDQGITKETVMVATRTFHHHIELMDARS